MKRPSPMIDQRGSGTDLNSAMTPMIDVVFLLLVFFVWTASFQIIEQILPSEVRAQMGNEPSKLDEPPPEEDFPENVVTIGWDGEKPSWIFNKQPISSLAELRKKLTVISSIKPDAPVFLVPDKIVPLGHVIEVYDISKLSGFNKVSFAVEAEQN